MVLSDPPDQKTGHIRYPTKSPGCYAVAFHYTRHQWLRRPLEMLFVCYALIVTNIHQYMAKTLDCISSLRIPSAYWIAGDWPHQPPQPLHGRNPSLTRLAKAKPERGKGF